MIPNVCFSNLLGISLPSQAGTEDQPSHLLYMEETSHGEWQLAPEAGPVPAGHLGFGSTVFYLPPY